MLDIHSMSMSELRDEVFILRAAITKMVTQRGDDFCWRDAYKELAKLVGIDFCPELMDDPDKMLENCKCFINSLYSGPYIPVYVEKKK